MLSLRLTNTNTMTEMDGLLARIIEPELLTSVTRGIVTVFVSIGDECVQPGSIINSAGAGVSVLASHHSNDRM